jgi:uncharacterized membrane protein (DUF4010 family)
MDDALYWVYPLAVALAIGLMIGSERDWQRRNSADGAHAAGLRTFGLIGLLGGLSGLLGQDSGVLAAAIMFVGVAVVLTGMYVVEGQRKSDLGATTEVAGLLTFVFGLLAGMGELVMASATAVVVVVILASKRQLHGWLSQFSRPELVAALKLLVISVVFLPLLPNQGYGPWNSVNPYVIWWMVVLIAGISFVGYFAVRVAGEKAGIIFTALFGGLASSTALTLHLSRLAAAPNARHRLLAGGILLACGTMFLRMLVVTAIIEFDLLASLLLPALVTGVMVLLPALWMIGRAGRAESSAPLTQTNPLDLKSAFLFGLLLALVMVLGEALSEWLGDAGVYLLALVSGLADVDAITLSLARLAGEGVNLRVATLGILIAATANSLVKAGISLLVGSRETGLPVLIVLMLASLSGLCLAWLDWKMF